MRQEWVQSSHYQCAKQCQGSCQFYAVVDELEKSNALLEEGMNNMSSVLWCDRHNGPFSGKDPNKQRFSRSFTDTETKQKVEDVSDICGPCASEFVVQRVEATQITSGEEAA